MDRDSTRGSLWFEDLERHRQPCLYYLSSEDDREGPHLVCDWNGPPTDYGELGFDYMRGRIDIPIKTNTNNQRSTHDDTESLIGDIEPQRNASALSHSLLTENDGARLDLLTVPPIVNSLMLKMFHEQGKKGKATTSVTKEQTSTTSESDIVKKPIGGGKQKKERASYSTTTHSQHGSKAKGRQ